MDEIISNIAALKVGYRMGNSVFNLICYADDAAIIAESEKDLQQMIKKFQAKATEFNLDISISKTKSMAISRRPSPDAKL